MSVPYPTALEQHPIVRRSTLETFSDCSLAGRFYLDHERGWDTHAQARGTIFHRVAAKILELLYERSQEGEVVRSIEVSEALAILDECLRQHDVPDEDVVNLGFKEVTALRWIVIKFANECAFDIEHLADVEQKLVAPIVYPNPAGGFVSRTISGTLDALFIPEDDWAVVLDWKTMWTPPPESELSDAGYFQQRVYGHHVMRRLPNIERVTLREHYVRKNVFREATVFRSELETIGKELGALVERFDRAVEHGKWPLEEGEEPKLWSPSPGSHCSYCPRPAACPIFPDARQEGAVTGPEMAERYAAEALVAEAARGHRLKALRSWTKANGPTPIKNSKDPNRVWGYKEVKRTERPSKEKMEAAIRANGGQPVHPSELYEEKIGYRFQQFTRDPEEEEREEKEVLDALEASVQQAEEAQSAAPAPPVEDDDSLPF